MRTPRRQPQALTPFAERMQIARKRIGLTQSEVAERLGLTQPTVSGLEIDGERSAYLPAFARLYGVDVYWLYSGEGDMLKGTGRRFSVEAEDLARLLDSIEDPEVKRRVYALSQLVADLGTLPTTAEPARRVGAEASTRAAPVGSATKRPRVSKPAGADSSEPIGNPTTRRKTRV
jgi:transcriptional regulator with XRE-family HTH domain